MELRKEVEGYFRSTRRPAILDYKELGGLSDQGLRNSLCCTILYGIWDMACPIPRCHVTTRVELGLVDTQGNYSSSTRVGSSRAPKLVSE